MKSSKIVTQLVLFFVLAYGVAYEGIWRWMICRKYVPQGYSMVVTFKGNILPWSTLPEAKEGFARVDEKGRPAERGILKDMPGPGRHFQFDPIHYSVELVPDTIIEPGTIGVVVSRRGKQLPPDQFLVDGNLGETEYNGTLRQVLRPGRYRVNPWGYEVQVIKQISGHGAKEKAADAKDANKLGGWIDIPSGSVGVVTNLVADASLGIKPGVQDEILQPGIYSINPKAQRVDIVEIGYDVINIRADLEKDKADRLVLDENGEPMLKKNGNPGINFPSADGFAISLDFTAIWGVMPEQSAKVIRMVGSLEDTEQKLIRPAIDSICRIYGSKLRSVDLLAGDSREKFQTDVSEEFHRSLLERNISLQVGLVRHIHIPPVVRGPLQKANIADEIKLTSEMEILTAQVEEKLEQARANVKKEEQTVVSDTERLYQEALAKGKKEVAELNADRERQVAAIARKTAEIDAKTTLLIGEADSSVKKLKLDAEAQRFVLAVKAFGSPEAYNMWVFANGLPTDMKLQFLYAGPGTMWTDLKGFQEAALGKMLQQSAQSEAPTEAPVTKLPVKQK